MLTGVMKPLPGILSENRNEDICGWKKVLYLVYPDDRHPRPEYKIAIAKLIIPKDAVVIFTNHKCRAPYAIVDGFYPADRLFEPGPSKKLDTKLAFSVWNTRFYYEDGKTVLILILILNAHTAFISSEHTKKPDSITYKGGEP